MRKIYIVILLILGSQLACHSDNSPEEDFEKARAYEKSYQFSKAYDIYKNIIKKYGLEEERQAAYRIEFIDKNQLVELEDAKIKGRIKDSEYYLVLGKVSLSEKELNDALLMLEKANSLEPNNPEILLKLGVAYNSIGDDLLHMLYNEDKAEIEKAQAMKRKGFVIFNRIINEHPQSELASEAQFMLGVYYGDNIAVWDNDYEKAISEYQKVLKNYPNSLKALAAQRDIDGCYIFLKNYEAAIDECKKVIKNCPKSEEAALLQNDIGARYSMLKNYTRAIEEYEKTIRDYPKSKVVERTLIDIARVYKEGLHNYQKAIETYKRYLKTYPHGEFERVVLDELKRLKRELK